MKDKIEDLNIYTKLFESYETLLTKNQQEIFKLFYYNDYSISEISFSKNINRSSVHKVLRNIEKKLILFEKNLKILKLKNELKKYNG